jgi:pSer/pThr/pTyr-binding forkhead associated (FHA) protein
MSIDVPIKRNVNVTVGRSRSSFIILNHPTISSNHLLIYSVMAPPHISNPLIFCRDLGSSNGTYFKGRRLLKDETILLNHGDCLDFRHAGRIYLLQFNVCMVNVDKVIGTDINLSNLDKTFQIQRRLIGEGGQAKVSPPSLRYYQGIH